MVTLFLSTTFLSQKFPQNTKSTTVLCIHKILKERHKALLKIPLIDVDSAYHQDAKTTEFIHFIINCGETSQGRPNRVLNRLLQSDVLGTSLERQY